VAGRRGSPSASAFDVASPSSSDYDATKRRGKPVCVPLKRDYQGGGLGSLMKYCNHSSCGGADALASFASPSQIAADMLSRRASPLHPPRSQSESPQYFNRLPGVLLEVKPAKEGHWPCKRQAVVSLVPVRCHRDKTAASRLPRQFK